MSRSRRRSQDAVRKAIPEASPQAGPAPAGVELNPGVLDAIGTEVNAAMQTSVLSSFEAQQSEQAPEDGAYGALAAGVSRVNTPPPGEPEPSGDDDPSEVASRAQQHASRALAEASGGTRLTEGDQEALGTILPDVDLDAVEIFENEPAVTDLDAKGAAVGNKIFLATRVDSKTPAGRALLAEEIAHTVQAGRGGSGEGLTLGGTNNAAEQEVGAVRAAAEKGEPAPSVAVATDDATIQRGEAGVHKNDISMPALGVDEHHFDDRGQDSGDLTPDERAALQVYAGNFMSDFSQANAPTVLNGLAHLPSGRGDGSAGIGLQGAGAVVQSIIQAFAILDLGTDAAEVVTAGNTEVYEAERHLDNPMGTPEGAFAVADGEGIANAGALDPTGTDSNGYTCVSTSPPTAAQLEASGASSPEAYRDRADRTNEQHAGSAVPGLQYENPALYEVSPTGLSNFLYNSAEAAKNSYREAARIAPRDMQTARMHIGYADHPIQDYFSHTNYIEVALNRYINDAMSGDPSEGAARENEGRAHLIDQLRASGPHREAQADADGEEQVSAQWVATYYDGSATVDGQRRDAITSGTFGGTDTMVSIAHTFMPLIPRLHEAMTQAIDRFAGLIENAPPDARSAALLEQLTSESREGAAFTTVLAGLGDAGVGIPAPTGIEMGWYEQEISPGWIGDPWTMELPDGTLDVEWGAGVPIMGAVDTYLSAYKTFQGFKDRVGDFADYIGVSAVRDQLQAAWDAVTQTFMDAIKQGMTSLLAALVVSITNAMSGEETSVEDYADIASANLDELLETAHHELHEVEERTSLSDRMSEGGDMHDLTVGGEDTRAELERQVGPVEGAGTEGDPWVPVNPLPPSHSEISKDHPPHDPSDHDHGHEHAPADHDHAEHADHEGHHDHDHDHDGTPEHLDHPGGGMDAFAHGSAFFGISNLLGREAMRHIYNEMDRVLQEATGREDRHVVSAEARARRTGEMGDHDAMLEAAEERAEAESGRAGEQGFRHAQSDASNASLLERVPSLRNVFNLVDLYIAHPEDNLWWTRLVDGYVAANADEVYAHILRRNGQNAAGR